MSSRDIEGCELLLRLRISQAVSHQIILNDNGSRWGGEGAQRIDER